MAFKSATAYNDERYHGMFQLKNDGDYADVIILYRNLDDMLVADAHYIKSSDYSGYVHHIDRGCPACMKGLRVQTKLFIPVYNIEKGKIEFWDRTMRIEPQLQQDVFSKYAIPCDYVFRITRKGAAGDVNTVYSIMAVGKNTFKSFDQIMSENNTSYPACFDEICKEVSIDEMNKMLASSNSSTTSGNDANMPSYQVTPRASFNSGTSNSETSNNASGPWNNDALPTDITDSEDEDDNDDVEF